MPSYNSIVHFVLAWRCLSDDRRSASVGVHRSAETLVCTVIPMSGGPTERQVQSIEDFRPDIIMTRPNHMLALLGEFRNRDKIRGTDP